jgi:hypothetical protein
VRRATAIALTVVTALFLPSAAGAQDDVPVLERVITVALRMNVPPGPCDVPQLTATIAKFTAAPAGIESLPGCFLGRSLGKPPEPTDVVFLQGLTVGEALHKLVEVDKRYYWTETEGVVVMRPVEAWGDAKHPFNKTVSLDFEEVDLRVALHEVTRQLRDEPKGLAVESMTTPKFSVKADAKSATEALDAIVRAHGSASWRLYFCRPERRLEFARVYLHTSDDQGVGAPAQLLRDANGRRYDACGLAK